MMTSSDAASIQTSRLHHKVYLKCKSLLGQALATTHPHGVHSFLNLGCELRKTGQVDQYLQHPSAASNELLRAEARKLLEDACLGLEQATACKTSTAVLNAGCLGHADKVGLPQVLLLECVKELDDAYTLLEVLQQHDIPLLQVLLLDHELPPHLLTDGMAEHSQQIDAEKLVKARRNNWRRHAAGIIEFFSALGVLVEVTAVIYSHNSAEQQPISTLASMGYAAAAAITGSTSSSAARTTGSKGCWPIWLQTAGWCDQAGKLRVSTANTGRISMSYRDPASRTRLQATLIQPVVSERLVTSRSKRDMILADAAAATGLSSSQIAVPIQAVATVADACWVAVPGRYHVSLKCDGTRHWLVVGRDGTPYLVNRARMLYKYPIDCSTAADGQDSTSSDSSGCSTAGTPLLPAGTILDGELVWVDQQSAGAAESAAVADSVVPGTADANQPSNSCITSPCSSTSSCALTKGPKCGYFVVFDALVIGGKRVWHLPLADRLAEAQQLGIPLASPTLDSEPSAAAAAAGAGMAAAALTLKVSNTKLSANTASSSSGGAAASQTLPSSSSSSSNTNSSATSAPTTLSRKQQAPPKGSDTVKLLLKQHYPVTPKALLQLQAEKHLYPCPSDGLVFTPSVMPYMIGMSQLLLKWQPEQQIAIDVTAGELPRAQLSSSYLHISRDKAAREFMDGVHKLINGLQSDLVYECLPVKLIVKTGSNRRPSNQHHIVWVPQSVRWDKHSSKQKELREDVEQRMKAGTCLTHSQLAAAVQEVQDLIAAAAAPSVGSSSSGNGTRHPAKCMAFEDLYAAVMQQVDLGTVEKWVDPSGSGLQVYCYIIDNQQNHPSSSLNNGSASSSTEVRAAAADKQPQDPIAALCRGLVLHPAGKTVVATPFVRFSDAKQPNNVVDSKGSSNSSSKDAEANLQLYKSWSSQTLASATYKLDGTFVIAFLWEGELKVATRRRMDSEQAILASTWLKAHANISNMQPGWTYMFEAIYKDNTHVIQYQFEDLVLLGAVSPDGCELPNAAARFELAQQLGVLSVPCITGSYDELLLKLGSGCFRPGNPKPAQQASSYGSRVGSSRKALVGLPSSSRAAGKPSTGCGPASCEGWVLQSADGRREKLVQLGFKDTGKLAKHNLHPLVVWDAVFCGANSQSIMKGLPSYYQSEADVILTALDVQFKGVHKLLQLEVEKAWALEGCRSAAAAAAADNTAAAAALAGTNQQTRLPTSQIATAAAVPPTAEMSASTASSSSSSSSSSDSTAAPTSSAAFQAALQYSMSRGTHFVSSMFKGPSAPAAAVSSRAPALRGLLLDCIRPATNGTLPGYSPSPAFKQTYAKGWQKGPQQGRMSVLAPEPLILQTLTDEAAICMLRKLQGSGRGVGAAMIVCRDWRRLIEGDPEFRAQAERWRGCRRSRYGYAHISDRNTWWDPQYLASGSDDDVYSYNSYSGDYGSP